MGRVIDRTGEEVIAKNGLKATIIEYRSARSMDVKFEDGCIIKDITYDSFKNGILKHPNINCGFKDRTGEISTASNGMKITICKYRGSDDLDIQFEDGTIVKHKTYRCFLKGSIRHESTKPCNIVGKVNTATNGQQMIITEYINCNDISVQFEDGTIVKHKSYASFRSGSIGNPNVNIKGKSRIKSRVGEKTYNLQGYNMKVIEYRNSNDIDVQFDDGSIVEHKSYDNFKRHKIAHPSYIDNKLMDSRIGETRTMYCGFKATIIAYRNFADIDIKFEDNVVVEHTNYRSFVNRVIKHPNISIYSCRHTDLSTERVGETIRANCGLNMTIVEYIDSRNVTIQFETGDTVKNKSYKAFKKGEIGLPNRLKVQKICKECIGKKVRLNSGELAECIAVTNKSDITIKFEKDGYIKQHVSWYSFIKGSVDRVDRHTKIQEDHQKNRDMYLGKEYYNNDGERFTIIEYIKAKDVSVRFDNGNIVRHRTMRDVELGRIANTTIKRDDYRQLRLGEQAITIEGYKVTIVKYNGAHDIDVQFEDGSIVKSRYTSFKKGRVPHPNSIVDYSKRIGETSYTTSGELMTIVRYNNSKDIDIQFEDGTILHNRNYGEFLKGKIKKNRKINEATVGEQVKCKNGLGATVIRPFECDKVDIIFEDDTELLAREYKAFKSGGSMHPKYRMCQHVGTFNNEKTFLCTCRKCGERHVLRLSEMKDFECEATYVK